MTKRAKFSASPTQRYQAEAYGVTERTIRNWNRKNGPNEYPRYLEFAREWRQAVAAYPKGQFARLFSASIVLHKIRHRELPNRKVVVPGDIIEPEQRKLWYETKLSDFIHPEASKWAQPEKGAKNWKHSKKTLYLAVKKLRLAGKDVTRRALADQLGVAHVRTLNRRYGTKTMREVCPITRRRKPKIDSGKLTILLPDSGSGTLKLTRLACAWLCSSRRCP